MMRWMPCRSSTKLLVHSGPPGTGKTRTAALIVKLMKKRKRLEFHRILTKLFTIYLGLLVLVGQKPLSVDEGNQNEPFILLLRLICQEYRKF